MEDTPRTNPSPLGTASADTDSVTLALTLSPNSPVPLYHQVATQLEQAIATGRLPKGTLLPNELELADSWGVSRPTARRAIQQLVDQGLLVRRRGVGTQVVSAHLRRQSALTSLYEEIVGADHTPATRVLELTEQVADEELATLLEIPVDSPVVYLHRLRLSDGEPLAVMRNWLPLEVGAHLDADELERDGLYRVLRARQVHPRVADRVIGATAADRQQARVLAVRVGAPLVTVQVVIRDERGACFDLGRHVYDAARYSIETRSVET